MKKCKDLISYKDIIKCIFLVVCYVTIEVAFRLQPEMSIQYVSPLDEVPVLFDLLYVIILVVIIARITNKKAKRLVYIFSYLFLSMFMMTEYIYCRIFDRIFGINTLQYAGEAKDFGGIVVSYFDKNTVLLLGFFVIVGIVGGMILPDFPFSISNTKKNLFSTGIIMFSIVGIVFIPTMFMDSPNIENGAFAYTYKKYIYKEWIDNKRALGMFGSYEFFARDLYLYLQSEQISQEDIAVVTEYFSEQGNKSNDMTGIFAGKNVVMVLMESIDDWLISEAVTPTIYKMMSEGINFPNMYTPIFGSGATVNTEFCSYTGLYAPSDGTPLVNYSNNSYPYALPNVFRIGGYVTKAFHYNSADFYNRQNLHHAVGFQKYISYLDYEENDIASQDTTLVNNEDIYKQFTESEPFFNYIITYTAHGEGGVESYSHESQELRIYPEYIGMYESEEMDSISAKARVTDDMFARLLENLQRGGLLQNTVIIAFGDHYDYMIHNQDYLKEISNANNIYELSKTPFFIWAAGMESQEITKVVNTMDIYPTLCNLFGLNNDQMFLGRDIFDEDYDGYAFWQDGSWIDANGAFYSSTAETVGSVSDEKNKKMQQLIKEKLKINQMIYDIDYFKYMEENKIN